MRISRQVGLLLAAVIASAVRAAPITDLERRSHLELVLTPSQTISFAASEELPRILLVPDDYNVRTTRRRHGCYNGRCGTFVIDMPPTLQLEEVDFPPQRKQDRYYESEESPSFARQPVATIEEPEVTTDKVITPAERTILSSFAADAGWTAPLIPSGKFLQMLKTGRQTSTSDTLTIPNEEEVIFSPQLAEDFADARDEEDSLILQDQAPDMTPDEVLTYEELPKEATNVQHDLKLSSDEDQRELWRKSGPAHPPLRLLGRALTSRALSKRQIVDEIIKRSTNEKMLMKRQSLVNSNVPRQAKDERDDIKLLTRATPDERASVRMMKRLKHDSNAFNSSMVGNGAGMYKYGHKIHDNTNGAAGHDGASSNTLFVSMALAAVLGVYMTL